MTVTTLFASKLTVTPSGTLMGVNPIRDMGLPDEAEDFAAEATLGSFTASHDALRGRNNGGYRCRPSLVEFRARGECECADPGG